MLPDIMLFHQRDSNWLARKDASLRFAQHSAKALIEHGMGAIKEIISGKKKDSVSTGPQGNKSHKKLGGPQGRLYFCWINPVIFVPVNRNRRTEK